MLFNKNLVAAGFTLALLVSSYGDLPGVIEASYGGAALCDERIRVKCTSDATCLTICLAKKGGRIDGYCSKEHVTDDPSCVCTKKCAGQSKTAAAAVAVPRDDQRRPLEKPARATAGRGGVGFPAGMVN